MVPGQTDITQAIKVLHLDVLQFIGCRFSKFYILLNNEITN